MTLAPSPGPCAVWTTADAVSAFNSEITGLVENGKLPTTVLSRACQDASDLLYVLSGRQFPGTCSAVLRPTARSVSRTLAGWSSYYTSLTGMGWSSTWGTCYDPDTHQGCYYPPEIDLGVYPLTDAAVVKIDGVVIPSNEYRIDNYRTLVRTRPNANATETQRWGWPTCQHLDLPDTEVGTFSVSATYGMAPPDSGVGAANALAAELAKARSGQTTNLPRRLTSITRQGVSFAVLDPMQFLDKGFTGVYDADIFIAAYNPLHSRKRPRVWSPDLGRVRRPTLGGP